MKSLAVKVLALLKAVNGHGAWLLAVLLLLTSAYSGVKPEPATVKLGALPMIVTLPAYVAEKEGFYRAEGVNVELVPFRSTMERNAALLAGEIDGIIADVFDVPALNKGEGKIRLAGDDRANWSMFAVVASPKSSLKAPADLKGVEVGVGRNTVIEYALDQMLLGRGMKVADITKVDVPSMPLRLELLNQGKLQAAILVEPLVSAAVAAGGKVIMDDSDKPLGGVSLLFRQESLEKKSQAVKKLMVAWHRGVEAIAKTPAAYQALMTEVASVPQSLAGTLKVPQFNKMRLPDAQQLESVANWIAAKGVAERAPYQALVAPGYLPSS